MKRMHKIGQLLMAGFEGTSPSKGIKKLISEYHIGGVILFSRNIESPKQLAKLTDELQALSPDAPLLIAIDQEGGRVSRLPLPFTQFPRARTVGRCDDVSLTYQNAEAICQELLAVGINMNFSPVLDINTNPKNPIIGDRAFGGNPTIVSKHSMATIAAMLDQYLIPCGKHFPGHGDTDTDSHKTLPVVDLATSRLTDRELRPFVHAIENRLTCVMTAHICCRAFDKELPASLSENIVTTLLRKTLKFQGVVVTDDLEMKGIRDHFSVAEAAVKAVSVGSDLLLVCHTLEEQVATLEALNTAVDKGSLTEARLDQSLGRLLFLKEHFILNRPKLNKAALQKMIGSDAHKRLVDSINIRGQG
ncbi:beta-N-acetylglucosaminidase [hydrothermal vent metagenome]|uniref:Beta-N-acetylglucosaminidase n=1 Tax=hydrothermal vent metagenome TaxID=652676 RepID=A0A3B1DLI5_9ZZZZ